jgi:hypothetical protein
MDLLKPGDVFLKTRKVPLGEFWSTFTADPIPQKSRAARCRHCKEVVVYHKKSEQVVPHLNRCEPFKKLVMAMAPGERPSWFTGRKRKNLVDKQLVGQGSLDGVFGRALSQEEQKQFESTMAMHFFLSGSAFSRIGEPNLLKALKILRPDVKVPSRSKMTGVLLDNAFAETYAATIGSLQSQAICLTTDAWSNVRGESVVSYTAACEGKSFYLESNLTGTQSHTGQWLAQDISRIVQTYSSDVAGVVTDNASPNVAAWKILAQKFPDKFSMVVLPIPFTCWRKTCSLQRKVSLVIWWNL